MLNKKLNLNWYENPLHKQVEERIMLMEMWTPGPEDRSQAGGDALRNNCDSDWAAL